MIKKTLLRPKHFAALLLIVFLLSLSFLTGQPPLASSIYNSYTLQALAWREGRTHLIEDVPYLELAIKDGNYYVSFPPVPSIPLFFLSFMFGIHTPDNLLVKLYALISFYALYKTFKFSGWKDRSAATSALLLCTASSILPLLMQGAVWYQAQVMAFMLTTLSISLMMQKKHSLSLICFALSVGCRPFNVLYALPLFALYAGNRKPGSSLSLRPLLPGILSGLCIAAAYAWYNWLRFGHPLEFGHNYLPEFSTQGGQQFSMQHILSNMHTFVLSLPFEQLNGQWTLRRFGFSLFIANPAFLIMLALFARDIVNKQVNLIKSAVIAATFIHLLFLLSHRTFGGYQLGARYAVDLIPYVALYVSGSQLPAAVKKPCLIVMIAGLLLNIYGTFIILLPA